MAESSYELVLGLLAAVGGGLLVGIERERSKGSESERVSSGVRTFALVALAGIVSAVLGAAVLIVAGISIGALVFASYQRGDAKDPGLTNEVALILIFLLGALASENAQLAAALFVAVALVLAFKDALHRFTRQVLTNAELGDLLLLAASVLIVLPLLPDRPIDPFDVLNPRKLWLLVVLVMTINAAGYVALRLLGTRRGLLLAGFLGGFVSSAATIGSMGERARTSPTTLAAAVAAGLMSNVATIVQVVVILAVLSMDLLRNIAPALGVAGVATIGVALLSYMRASSSGPRVEQEKSGEHPFGLGRAVLLASIISIALLLSAGLRAWLGASGVIIGAAAAGFADIHAAAVSLGQMNATLALPAEQAGIAFGVAFAANSAVKCVVAYATGGSAYARPIVAGILVINLALVAGLLL